MQGIGTTRRERYAGCNHRGQESVWYLSPSILVLHPRVLCYKLVSVTMLEPGSQAVYV